MKLMIFYQHYILLLIGLLQMIKKFLDTLYANENILYFDEDSDKVVFHCDKMGIRDIDFNNINLDNDFDEDNPGTNIHVRLLAWQKI